MNKLAQCIIEYESDTFSSSDEDITDEELKGILDEIYDSIIDNHLDGVWLSQLLDNVRLADKGGTKE